MSNSIDKPGVLIKRLKEYLEKNESATKVLENFNEHCNTLRKPSDISNYLNKELKLGSTVDVVSALVCSYATLTNEAFRNKDEHLIDGERVETFKAEIEGILTPEQVKEPYHHIPNIPSPYRELRREALLINACNDLAHAYEKTFCGKNERICNALMQLKDKMLVKYGIMCLKEKQKNPDCKIEMGYTKDRNGKEVLVTEIPYVGQVAWHFSPKHGKEPFVRMVNNYFTKENVKEELKIQNPVTVKPYVKKMLIDPKNNSSRLMNDVMTVGPNRGGLTETERRLRSGLIWTPGGFENGVKQYSLKVKEEINKNVKNENGFEDR